MSGLVVANISMSLDGYVAGPHDGLGRGLGEGGEPIHNWVMGGPWSYADGPRFEPIEPDRTLAEEMFAEAGAAIVGRRMYDVVDGWGDEAAFPFPVFVLTSRPHPKRDLGSSSYTFVTDGIDSALAQAREAAGDKDVSVGGGARTVQQYLAADLADELYLHVSPIILGGGTRLFDGLDDKVRLFDIVRVVDSPLATHIRYRIK
jgi:dihydrofolate reductase